MDGKGERVPVKQQDDYDGDEVVEAAVIASSTSSPAIIKGEMQPPAYRDWHFSVLFFVQMAAIAATAISFGPAMFESLTTETDDYDNSNSNYNNNNSYDNNNQGGNRFLAVSSKLSTSDMIFFFVGSLLAASVVVMSVFRVMIHYPLEVIKVSFFMAPVTFGAVALVILAASAAGNNEDGGGDVDVNTAIVGSFWAMGAFFSIISICYYFCYKRFMPFAAVNLQAALSAVRANMGLFFLSVGALFVIYAWTILWVIAMGGILYHDQQKEQVPCSQYYDDDTVDHPTGMCDQQPNAIAITMLVLCFYWTQQVIQNTVHTTTAGTVGSWWVQPAEDNFARNNGGGGCCGQDVSDSLHRSCTYSFGSICLGSLLVAILQTLEAMARNNRNRRDVLSIVLQCIIMCFRAWLEYFNSWAFCYVGIYGYSYVEAGRKVIELFKSRGWTTFITDRLIFRVLLMANWGIAALTGALCVLLMLFLAFSKLDRNDWAPALVAAFWFGFVVGLIVSNTVLFVVESATRTVMVCFAEQPMMVEGGRPMLQNLKETYAATYPDIFRFDVELENRPERNVV
mmetsp:Transcript_1456/g.1998  ORF Transcript_1456/g.1998 Transcript_1456/m.1998 type:complete len:567 (+) Transcript_1456:103-1803(+)